MSKPKHKETVTVTRRGNWYVARYATLNIVVQGKTMEKALISLLWTITLTVDSAVERGRLGDLVVGEQKGGK